MKINVLHVTFNMAIGGAQQVIRQIINNLPKQDFHSEVVCLDNEIGEIGESLIFGGVRVHLLSRKGLDFLLMYRLMRLIKSRNIDVLHCHQYTPYFYGVLASIPLKTKIIFTEHGRFFPDYGTWKRKLINPFLVLFTYKIVSISIATKKALIKHENFSDSTICVIHNGVTDLLLAQGDPSLKERLLIGKDEIIIGTVSRLQPIKNQVMMIVSLAGIIKTHPECKLLFVGDGPSRDDLLKCAKRLNIEAHVIFVGNQIDTTSYHKIIDVFALTSYSEGMSMSLLEALSFGKPCVVTNVGGNPEIVKEGQNGYIIESEDTTSFIACCNSLIENNRLRVQMGRLSRKEYELRYRVEDMVLNYQQLYLDATDRVS